jgi:hypothetical protein
MMRARRGQCIRNCNTVGFLLLSYPERDKVEWSGAVVSRFFRTLVFVGSGFVGFASILSPGKAGVRWRRREWVSKLVGAAATAARPGRSRCVQPAVAACWVSFS